MAEARMEVAVSTDVEFSVGDKTAAWLMSLGWTPPVEETVPAPEEAAGSDLVNNTRAPYASMPEALEAMNGRQAAKYQAQQDYQAMKAELSSPERLDNLLKFFGVQLPRFIEVPVTDAPTES